MRFELRELDRDYAEVVVHINGHAVNEGVLDHSGLSMLKEEIDSISLELTEIIGDNDE